jgi:SAM-dependent methyltransferase
MSTRPDRQAPPFDAPPTPGDERLAPRDPAPRRRPAHLVRIPDWGVTEQFVQFADDFVLDRVPAGAAVLDIGCGYGVFCERLAEKARRVVGIDVLPEVIEVARARHARPNVTYLRMAAEDLDRLDDSFDVIVSRYCFHHVDVVRAAPGIQARLRPGGTLVAIDCYEGFWRPAGRAYVLRDAWRRMGPVRFLAMLPRCAYFLTPSRRAHVREDIRRLKREGRYTWDEVGRFYARHLPGSTVGRVGCAVHVGWTRAPHPPAP